MGNKDSRAGGKFSGNHTTLIPAAVIVADIANKCPFVTEISPGFIKSGLKSANGHRRVKISDVGGNVLLGIRDNTSFQEVHVYSRNMQATKLAIAIGARNAGLSIAFGKKK